MADVIVIGGGLSGLAAAWELEQRNIPYTLIEVKGRLGGGIISEARDGFVLDGGPMLLRKSREWPWLAELGLSDALFPVTNMPTATDWVAFKHGTQTLVDALAERLKMGRIMPRMSVSTLGRVDHNFAVCLENGMVIQAAALIVAAPAHYAERMFYTFEPQISQHLLGFHYDSITRVSLGYRQGEIDLPVQPPPDAGYAFDRWTASEHRVPSGHVLVQVGLRYAPGDTPPQTIIAELQKDMGWPATHVVARVDHWPQSHCLTAHEPNHVETLNAIDALLPDGVALVGSDYRGYLLEDRVEQGIAAAQKIAAWLGK